MVIHLHFLEKNGMLNNKTLIVLADFEGFWVELIRGVGLNGLPLHLVQFVTVGVGKYLKS